MADTTPPASYGGLRVLIAGGGVAALEALCALRALAGDRVDIELLAPEPRFLYRPLSVREPFGGDTEPEFELADLAEAADAGFTLGELTSVEPERCLARTSHGSDVSYDALLVACGARPRTAVPGALTFRGPADRERMELLVEAARRGTIGRVLFVVPDGPTRPLPLYELAFQLRKACVDAAITIVTAEHRAVVELGRTASDRVSQLLDAARIEVRPGEAAPAAGPGEAVVAAPLLEGQRVLGLDCDEAGFVATDGHARVLGVENLYAAGDITDYPIRHGSIAAAQAVAAAEAIAARAGAPILARPFHPVLRAQIVTSEGVVYACRDLTDPRELGTVSNSPLWSPPAKIATRYLAPVLAKLADRQDRLRRGRSSIFAGRRD
jgi:sulfide:quinone oxidoreductase